MLLILFLAAFSITLTFYSIERAQFLFWNWSFYQNQPWQDLAAAFFHGVRFDFSAVSILAAAPFFAFWLVQLISRRALSLGKQRLLLLFFVLLQIPTMIINLGDAEFINFLGRRYTFDALFFMREIPGKFWNLTFFYWKLNLINLTILTAFAVLVIVWLPPKLHRMGFTSQWSRKKALVGGFALFVILGIGARGGLQRKPINFAHAQVFLNPSMNNLVLNSSFTFLQTIRREGLPRDHFFPQPEMLETLKTGLSTESLLKKTPRPVAKPNIVLIILESFALEYMGRPHQGQGYTPFLDELSQKSLYFDHAYANARRSIEGVGAIVGGVPALMNEPFISSQYLTNYFLGMGTWLQRSGYHTSFFHGAQNGSMYFDQFMKSAGVQNYFGLNEYPRPEDTDGTWGIWDEPFLKWMHQKINEFPQPFFTSVFTLSSHNPFKLPPQYEGRFPKGTLDIHETIGYTDFALKEFFAGIHQEKWFRNTIFIITADHTYKSSRPEYENEIGRYRVPLLIYSPHLPLPKVDESQVVQHIDILPTVLDLVGIETKEKNYLGESVFVPGDRTAVSYSDGRYLLIAKDFFLTYRRGGDFQMFAVSDPQETKPLDEPANRKDFLVRKLKATIQYFSQGMWDNKLYYPTGR